MLTFKLDVSGGTILLPPLCSRYSDLDAETMNRLLKAEKEEFDLVYRRYLERILFLYEDGEKMVYWYEHAGILKEVSYFNYRLRPAVEQYINSSLLTLGILTENPEEAWSFSDQGMNPEIGLPSGYESFFIGRAFFVNEEDIIEYGRSHWKDRTDWSVFQMKNVIKKEGIC